MVSSGRNAGPTRRRSMSRRDSSGSVATTPAVKQLKQSPRLISYCTGWFLPKNLCCSGCVAFSESFLFADDLEMIEAATSQRDTTHTSKRYICRQPWKQNDDSVEPKNKVWISKVKAHCQSYGVRINRLEEDNNNANANNLITPGTQCTQRTDHRIKSSTID